MVLGYKIGDDIKSVTLDYKGGNRFPRLERIEGKPDLLGELLKPR